jgi:hypothetical protein
MHFTYPLSDAFFSASMTLLYSAGVLCTYERRYLIEQIEKSDPTDHFK